jgi:chaperonin GroES
LFTGRWAKPTPSYNDTGFEKHRLVNIKRGEKMKIRPLNDRVLLVRQEKERKTTGGIIIPDTAKEKSMLGKVVAVGPGKRDEKGNLVPMNVKKGDQVLFSEYAGNEIKIEDIDHVFMREDDIFGVID